MMGDDERCNLLACPLHTGKETNWFDALTNRLPWNANLEEKSFRVEIGKHEESREGKRADRENLTLSIFQIKMEDVEIKN